MTVRTRAWLKAHFMDTDPNDFVADLVDSFGGADALQGATAYYVESGHTSASDSNDGTDPDAPLATLDGAFGKSLAAGDVVFCQPGHVEDLGDAQIDLDIAGVFVLGLGSGKSRPRIDFNHANASIDIGANDVTLAGFRLQPSVTDVLIGVDVEAGVTGAVIVNNEVMPGEDGAGVDEFVLSVDVKAGCHGTVIVDNDFYTHASAAGCTDGVKLTGASNRCKVGRNSFQGNYSTAAITSDTAASGDVLVWDNVIKVKDGEPGIEFHANTTGRIWGNKIASTGIDPDAAIVAADCEWFENYAVEADGETGSLIGAAADDPTNWIGENSANNDADTSTVTDNKDGSVLERLEDITQELSGADGLVAYPAGAAAANAVSLAEVLRYVQENVIVGAGDALPADQSLYGILAGATGIAAFPAGAVAANDVSLAEVLRYVQESGVGAQGDAAVQASGTASTQAYLKGILDVLWQATGVAAWPAAARAANGVSMAESLRYTQEVQEQCCVKADGAVLNGQDDLFDIAGGPVLVTAFVGIVTTIIGGAATCHIDHTSTTPGGDIALSTTVAVDNDAAGTSYTFSAATPGVLTPTTAGTIDQFPNNQWVLPIGTLKAECSAAQSGVIAWYMFYKPLSPDSVVTAAA